MRLTIVNGFFLPVPPLCGGSTEKTWHRLGRLFAARGHPVVSLSRSWPGFPAEEQRDGVRHLRLPGAKATTCLGGNLLRDLRWSIRVHRALPPADVVVCNAVTLPFWLGALRPAAGRVVVMCGRQPRGQYRFYSRLARVLAPSEGVRVRLLQENPALAPRLRTVGYPIDWSGLAGARAQSAAPPGEPAAPVTIGFVGRLHREKGLLLLAEACALLRAESGLPPWRILLCGPGGIAEGGSGAGFHQHLRERFAAATPPGGLEVLPPQFDDLALAAIYRRIDVFCYPSLPSAGETFGVAVAEAMAAGAMPVVSDLDCFRDLVRDDRTGLVFSSSGPGAAERLAAVLRRALLESGLRQRLAAQARAAVQPYDYPAYADRLLADFQTLAGG